MKLGTFLRLTVSLVLICAIVWLVGGIEVIVAILSRIDPRFAAIVLLVMMLDRALMTYKWIVLLKGRAQYLPFFSGLKIYCASGVYGLLLPSTVGADAIRAFMTTRFGLDANTIVASIVVERMAGFIGSLVLALIGLGLLSWLAPHNENLAYLWWGGGGLLAFAVIAFSVSFTDRLFQLVYDGWLKRFTNFKIFQKLRKLHAAYLEYRVGRWRLAVFFALSFIEQFFSLAVAWLIALSLHIEIGLIYIVGALPVAMLLSRLPISIDGIGVFEAAFVSITIAISAGVTPAETISISFAARILQFIFNIPWTIAYAIDAKQLGVRLPNREA